jgi:hypothetical protein
LYTEASIDRGGFACEQQDKTENAHDYGRASTIDAPQIQIIHHGMVWLLALLSKTMKKMSHERIKI